jgi:hypothetical protein
MLRRLALPPLAALALASCSTVPVTKGIDPASSPDPKVGYIAGSFAVWGDDQFAFQLVPRGTKRVGDVLQGEWHLLAFADAPDARNLSRGQKLQLLAVPPGEYRVASWVVYRKVKSGEAHRKDFREDEPMSTRFLVKPGHVVYLGAFSGNTSVSRAGNLIRTEWTVLPQRTRADEVPQRLATAYPRFAGTPLECLVCVAPSADATEAATPVILPGDAP